ncbi:hypothetical protein JYT31_02310 [Beggiatoa alba]|nr:hypothetical protein [Beggiatoa alba]
MSFKKSFFLFQLIIGIVYGILIGAVFDGWYWYITLPVALIALLVLIIGTQKAKYKIAVKR